ncbi:MAG: hypothetical protein OEZ35_02810 [Candidatus Bathyarchaeota archaeon]|nr:hypothetical protein [Candidatus Bathyarchaeota archaeon]
MSSEIVGQYPLESLQIYFNGSLEIQEEMIRKGFHVPLITPLPIIYGDMAGYEDDRTSRTALKPAILHPRKYGKSLEEMGWTDVGRKIIVPNERAKLLLKLEKIDSKFLLHFTPKFEPVSPGYHLEKASYRGINPTRWKNWAAFYTNIADLIKIIDDLTAKIGFPRKLCSKRVYLKHEKLRKGGGHEDTYFVSFDRDCHGIEPYSYSLCMGCWDYVMDYLEQEIKEHERLRLEKPSIGVKLRLEKDPDVPVRLKIGVSKMTEKRPQFMVKFSTIPTASKTITGIDKEGKPLTIEGKPRGKCVWCDHKERINELVMDAFEFLRAACAARRFCLNTDGPLKDRNCSLCFSTRLRPPEWFPKKNIQKQPPLDYF